MEYQYNKSPVDVEALEQEIKNSSITTELDYVTFEDPDVLTIGFVSELSTEEKSTLDSIVAAHTGEELQWYRFYCADCDEYFSGRFPGAPTVCCNCGGSNLSEVAQQEPCLVGGVTPEGDVWDWYMADSQGTVIWARRCKDA
jgi:hypothetical protein